MSIKNLDWEKVLDALASYSSSSLSKEHLSKLQPLPSKKDAIKNVETIEECKNILIRGIRPKMNSLELYDTWYGLVEKGAKLSPLHLKDIKFFLIETLALNETVENVESPILVEKNTLLLNPDESITKIESLLTDDGFIRSDASPTLASLNKSKNDISKSIKSNLEKLVKSYEIEDIIQDRFVTTREGRWVLPIKSGMQHRFSGIIHDSSQSKQTVFMEPTEVINANNKIKQIELDIKKEIERLLKEISKHFYNLSDQIATTKGALLFYDIFLSKAELALKTDALAFEFSDNTIQLNDLRNPYLLLKNETVIENSVELNEKTPVLILSGPNAGGKTVLLKSIGLALQMARCGLQICAGVKSKVPFISGIVSGVGDFQNLSENLSSFASHLQILQSATNLKGLNNLILIDEICSSTDPEEGSALARSFIEEYADNNVFTIITSHFSYLKNSLQGHPKIISGSLEFKLDEGPTYKFLQGITGQSLAIQTAKRSGVSESILEKAVSYLSPNKQELITNIDEITELKTHLDVKSKELERSKKAYKEQVNKYKLLIAKYEQEKEQLLEQSVLKAEKKINDLMQVNKAGDVFRKNNELLKIKQQLPEVVKAKKSERLVNSAEEFAEKFPPGSRVFIPSLKKEGLVQSQPNAKGLVDVVSQSMRLQLNWKLLKPNTLSFKNPTEEALRKKGFFNTSAQGGEKALDVRGLSIDESIEKIEVELDKATVMGVDRVKIIHGHGTNSLKRAIRSYLSRCLYVKSWTSGTKNSGGDGTTWVEIKDEH